VSSIASRAKPWRPCPDALTLCAWSDAELASVSARLGEMLRTWAKDWDLPMPMSTPVTSTLAPGRQMRQEGWEFLGSVAEAGAWFSWRPEGAARWVRAWFATERVETPVVASVVRACREDAARRLAMELHLSATGTAVPVVRAATAAWSGTLMVCLAPVGQLLLEAGVLRHLRAVGGVGPRERAPTGCLVGIRQALARTPLRVSVDLEGCELTLGALQALQLGDVVRLRHRVDAPASVADPQGRRLFGAWLARSRGSRAVELAAPDAA